MHIPNILYYIFVYIVIAWGSTGCSKPPSAPEGDHTPHLPAAHHEAIEALKDRISAEKELRTEAQDIASREKKTRRRWEVAAVVALVTSIVAFLIGTAIGSIARKEASR